MASRDLAGVWLVQADRQAGASVYEPLAGAAGLASPGRRKPQTAQQPDQFIPSEVPGSLLESEEELAWPHHGVDVALNRLNAAGSG